jgi:hypothetical protein
LRGPDRPDLGQPFQDRSCSCPDRRAGEVEVLEALRGLARDGQTCEDLVVSFAQAHGVLDLEPDEASRSLVEALAAERGWVVLSPAQDEAYRRYVARFLEMHFNNAFDRFLFRGVKESRLGRLLAKSQPWR